MPFNGSNGTFNRLYSWTADAAANIKILASRMDAEMNGFAAGLSNCVTRDGQSPPSADLPMGGKKLVNLGTPTTAGDAVTKAYADALVAGGPFAPLSGAAFTGAISGTTAAFSGALSASTGAFTGAVSAAAFTAANGGSNGYIQIIPGDALHTGYVGLFAPGGVRQGFIGYATTAGIINYASDTGAVHQFSGAVLNSTGGLQSNGSPVWHSGNFNPANYAALSGATFSGGIAAAQGSFSGQVAVDAGGAQALLAPSGDITARRADGTGVIFLGNTGSRYLYYDGSVYQMPGAQLNVGGAVFAGGQRVWDAGNLNPALYAPLSGAAFSGGISAPTVQATSDGAGTNFAVGNDVWIGDINVGNTMSVRGQSDATSGFIRFGSQTASLGVGGGGDIGVVGGNFGVQSGYSVGFGANVYMYRDNATGALRINFANNVYAYYDGSSKFIFAIGGGNKFSIDSSGTIRAAGNIIGNTTP